MSANSELVSRPARHTVAVNPIISGFHPDPSICRIGRDFFLVTSSFNYFPALPLFHSKDLANWRLVGHVLDRPSQVSLPATDPSEGLYAATIRAHRGRLFVCGTNVSAGGNFVVSTQDPYGPWSEPVWLDQTGIDPGIAFTDDHRVLLATTATGGGVAADPTATHRGVEISEIDVATGRRRTPLRRLSSGWRGQFPEGPRFVRRNGWWYLLLAEGGTEHGHMVTIGRSRYPDGPYEGAPHNPILTHRSQEHPFQAIGHADLVDAPDGSWWLVCLGIRPTGHPATHVLGRETFLAPVTWHDDWPVPGTDARVPLTVPLPWPADTTRSRSPNVSSWCTLGVPQCLPDDPALASITLSATTASLADRDDHPALLLHRQQHHAFRVGADIIPPETPGAEAGLVVWSDQDHHYAIGVLNTTPGPRLITHRRIGSLTESIDHGAVPLDVQSPVAFTITGDSDTYRLGIGPCLVRDRCDVDSNRVLLDAPTRYLSTEVAGGFTGVLVGAYLTCPNRTATARVVNLRYTAGHD